MTSYPFAAAGNYPVAVRVVNLAEGGTCADSSSAASLSVITAPLSVQLLRFGARAHFSGAELSWLVRENDGLVGYSIERSTDGRQFSSVDFVAAVSAGGEHAYAFTDREFSGNKTFYRLSLLSKDGSTTYSGVTQVGGVSTSTIATVSPNPFSDHFAVAVEIAQPALLEVRITDMTGRVCVVRTEHLGAGAHLMTGPRTEGLAPGLYVAEVLANGQRVATVRMEKR
jgi:hypothetical protein